MNDIIPSKGLSLPPLIKSGQIKSNDFVIVMISIIIIIQKQETKMETYYL